MSYTCTEAVPRQVTAFSNETVKRIRSLRDKKARREEGLFLAEGLRIIAEARDSGRLPDILAFSAQGAAHPLAAEIIASDEDQGAEAIEVPPELLAKMSGKDNPQMLLGAFRAWLDYRARREVVETLRDLANAGREPPAALVAQLDAR